MLKKNLLIAHFWANANQITTPTGVELNLENDNYIILSVLLRNHEDYPERYQLKAELSIERFIDLLELDTLEELDEISIETMFTLLVIGHGGYSLFTV